MKSQEHDRTTYSESDILSARLVALDILTQVLDRKQALDITLEGHQKFNSLAVRDRAFVRMLTTSTIRRLGQIDNLITRAQERPETPKTPLVMNILRLGVAQMFFMVVPDHASVDTSVSLAEAMGIERQKGFINAVLRRLTRDGSKWLNMQDPGRLNTPDWLLKIWIADYGLGTTAEIAAANLNEAPLDITIKNPDDKAYLGNVLRASELATGSLRRLIGGNVKEMEGYEEGRWWIQDAAAALPATLFGRVEGMHVVDLCAAPGGKTMQLAAMGANVTAIDRSAKRMKRLEENLVRMKLKERVEIEIADATAWLPKKQPFRILLDAPCSATGTIRRHPDTAYLKTERDMEGLIAIQQNLLHHAANLLGAGGMLIYCTCSLQKDEGERQIERFLASHSAFKRMPIAAAEVGGYTELINEQGDLRILPSHLSEQGGMDGFFISRLVRQ